MSNKTTSVKYLSDDGWDSFSLFHGMPDDLVPTKGSDLSAGFDLRAACDGIITPNALARVPTGVRVNIPANHVGMVCSRSGLAYNHGIFIVNSPGIIDEDYEGEIVMILGRLPISGSEEPFAFRRGDRLAQLVILPIFSGFFGGYIPSEGVEQQQQQSTKRRGTNGFGSTGIS